MRSVIPCLLLALAYCAVRYHVFGDVPWVQLPFYTVNKAIAFSAAALLAGIALFRPPNGVAMKVGLTAISLAVAHALMSAVMLSPEYYAKLYEHGKLNLAGETGMLLGCAAFVLLLTPAVASIPSVRESLGGDRWRFWQNMRHVVLALTAVHVTALGLKTWLAPGAWPGGMPPVTLLSCLVIAAGLVAKFLRRR